MIRRRKPRFEFVQILNAVARDYRVSWRARGLLTELLSYPADYETSVDELVKKAKRQGGNVEGRDAMRKAARELKDIGYIVETRHQDERGRWVTDLEVTDDPMYDLITRGDDVPAGQTDDGFSGVGFPGVGKPGVIKKTEKKTEKKTSPPTPPHPASDGRDRAAGREDESPNEEPARDSGLAQVLTDEAVRHWPSNHRAPSARDRQRLSERVAEELADGGDPDVIFDELTRDLSSASSAVRVIMSTRTRDRGWGRRTDPRPDHSRYEITGPRPAWCGRCDERTRLVVVRRADGSEAMTRCECHPQATPDFGTTESDVPPLEDMLAELNGERSAKAGGKRPTLSEGARAAAAEARRRMAELNGTALQEQT